MGFEAMSTSFKQRLDLLEVVDFAVEYDVDGSIFARNRLMAASKINNREPSHAESYPGGYHDPLIIRPPMRNHAAHAIKDLRSRAYRFRPRTPEINESCNTTHVVSLTFITWI